MINDEQARALWQRAAELQAAAERQQDRQLPVRAAEPGSLTLEQVAHAAEAAGIDPDYVRVAVAEQQLPDADRIDPQLWSARWLRALLREPDSIELSHLIAAAPAHVLNALRTVVARPPFELMHEATVGADPLVDAVLAYRTSGNNTAFGQSLNFSDVRVLLFTLRAEQQQTRLRVRAPLYRRGVNLGATSGFTALFGWGGAALGNVASGLLPVVAAGSALVAAAPIVLGALAGGALGFGAYKKMYRSFYNSGRGGLSQLLHAIAHEAESARAGNLPSGQP